MLSSKRLIPQALGAQLIKSTDELLFLLDSVYLQRLAPQAAVELFLNSDRKPLELAEAFEHYVRMRFAVGVSEANDEAKENIQCLHSD